MALDLSRFREHFQQAASEDLVPVLRCLEHDVQLIPGTGEGVYYCPRERCPVGVRFTVEPVEPDDDTTDEEKA